MLDQKLSLQIPTTLCTIASHAYRLRLGVLHAKLSHPWPCAASIHLVNLAYSNQILLYNRNSAAWLGILARALLSYNAISANDLNTKATKARFTVARYHT